jgi:acetyltransferase-like isoleucine patch superfamily enzyme
VRSLALIGAVLIALLPSAVKILIYRWCFGYRIGRGVHIGFSPFLGVRRCSIGDYTRIGSFNLFKQIDELVIGSHVRIGFANGFRGGEQIRIDDYGTILRLNLFNAIVEADFVQPVASTLHLGKGVFVATGHWLDFSDGIRIGDHSILGGRHSTFWTHNRQRGRPIAIGCHAYLGSNVCAAPGTEIPGFSIVALGSVLSGVHKQERVLLGGNPAKMVRPLDEDDLFLVARKTRNDIPNVVAREHLPEDLCRLLDRTTPPNPNNH